MAAVGTASGQPVQTGNLNQDIPGPDIHIEERRWSLIDFLKYTIKANGSDLHLQSASVPMVRVNGRAKFLNYGEITDEDMENFVNVLCHDPEKKKILEKRGA